jgi:type I restriction enzyme, S subunit
VKQGWEVKQLGELAAVIAGQSPKATFYNTDGAGVPFYQGKKEFSDKYLGKPTTWTTKVTKEAIPNDILMSVRAPVGPINIATESICIGRGLAAIRASDRLDREYLWYVLLWKQPEITGNAGAVFASINKAGIAALDIPLPPLEEQKRIVAVLDEAFEGLARARAHTEANLQNARELFEVVLEGSFELAQFDSTKVSLGEVVDISHGFAFKSKEFEVSDDATKPIVLTPGNYTEDARLNFTSKNTKRLMRDAPDKFLFLKGDLTVVMTDLSSKMKILGKPAFVEAENVLHNQRIGRVRFKSDHIIPRFLYHFLRTKRALTLIKESATGTMVRHTAPKRILGLMLNCPTCTSDQSKIVDQIDMIENSLEAAKFEYHYKLRSLDQLKQSILQKALAGGLT